MQPNELLEQLAAKNIAVLDNQAISNSMAAGCEVSSLMGPPPGAKSLILGEFSSNMPDANNNAHSLSPDEPKQDISFNIPTTPDV